MKHKSKVLWMSLLVCALALTGVAFCTSAEYLSATSALPHRVTVNGVAERQGWLGISGYAKGAKTPAFQEIRYVSRGSIRESFTMTTALEGGTFEVALWDGKVTSNSCTTKNCQWCARNGYHMSGMRSYTYGTVSR